MRMRNLDNIGSCIQITCSLTNADRKRTPSYTTDACCGCEVPVDKIPKSVCDQLDIIIHIFFIVSNLNKGREASLTS